MNIITNKLMKPETFLKLFAVFVLLMGVEMRGVYAETANPASIMDLAKTPIKNSLVCMMNNKFMGTEQIPVPVEGKTYYGCCKGCAAMLESNQNNVRHARDPYSGEEVDKAEAFIALKSPATQEVLYFKSEENYERYSESVNSQNMSKL